jgi:citrate lyase beta subunit
MILTRSLLFVPALNARALEKSKALDCDAVILDLEDSIAPDRKAEARDTAINALSVGGFAAPHCMVRVNSIETIYFDGDIRALAKAGVDAIVVPKVSSAADIQAALRILDAEPNAKDTKLWIMIETALGVMNLAEICAASPRLTGMIVGPNDLLKDLRAKETANQEALMTSYGLCLLAARAYGLICIDGVYKHFKDTTGFAANCAQGRRLGFDGKSLIHPAQIGPTNAAFGPSPDDVDLAKRQIQAFEDAKAHGFGVATLDGALVEALHVKSAHSLLEMAAAIAQKKDR